MVSSSTSFHCCGVHTRLSRGRRCCGGQPGQVLLTPGERDRLRRAGQHLVPLRVGPAVAGPGEQQVDPLLRRCPRGRVDGPRSRPRRAARPPPTRTCAAPGRRRPTAARQARPAYDGPAASQCRESSATRSSGATRAATSPPSESAWATRACWRASPVGVVVAATASRVSAWAKATTPGLGLADQSGLACRGERVLDLSSASWPAIAASTSSEHSRPRTAASSSSDLVSSGSPRQASGDDVADVAGSGVRVPAESGELDQEERVALRSVPATGPPRPRRCRRRARRPTPGVASRSSPPRSSRVTW